MFETILVPVDGSDHSNKAVDLAAGLSSQFNARVILLHVILRHSSAIELKALCNRLEASDELIKELTEIEEVGVSPSTAACSSTIYSGLVTTVILDKVGFLITDSAKKLSDANGAVNIEVLIGDGDPADLILSSAENENADVIIMGSRGLGHIKGMLVGSVSHKVNHLSKCTCITVK